MTKNKPSIYFLLLFASISIFSCSTAAPGTTRMMPQGDVLEFSRASEAPTENRMITYSASLELSVKNMEETKFLLLEQVKTSNGFIVRESDNSITTRIPSQNMDNFLTYSKTLGKVENESKTGTDITDQYRDNLLRLENLKTVRSRYLALLDRANTVTDILAIEKELERVNLEIERLEGRIQHAEQSTAYSSITIRFWEKTKPGPLGWIFVGLYHGVRWLFVWN